VVDVVTVAGAAVVNVIVVTVNANVIGVGMTVADVVVAHMSVNAIVVVVIVVIVVVVCMNVNAIVVIVVVVTVVTDDVMNEATLENAEIANKIDVNEKNEKISVIEC